MGPGGDFCEFGSMSRRPHALLCISASSAARLQRKRGVLVLLEGLYHLR